MSPVPAVRDQLSPLRMKEPNQDDLSNLSMLELFRVEAENQIALLTGGLLELERACADEATSTTQDEGKATASRTPSAKFCRRR